MLLEYIFVAVLQTLDTGQLTDKEEKGVRKRRKKRNPLDCSEMIS